MHQGLRCHLQSNLSSLNPDASFTMADSNSFLSPFEILPIAPENKYIFLSYHEIVCTRLNRLT